MKAEAAAFIKAGYYIGVTGYLGKKRRGSYLRSCFADVVPLNRVLPECAHRFLVVA